MFFRCKVCAEKDLRISDLKSQIADLKAQLYPSNHPAEMPSLIIEADAALSSEEPTKTSRDEAIQDEISERDRLLAGTY